MIAVLAVVVIAALMIIVAPFLGHLVEWWWDMADRWLNHS